jgi:hypothetical protein
MPGLRSRDKPQASDRATVVPEAIPAHGTLKPVQCLHLFFLHFLTDTVFRVITG